MNEPCIFLVRVWRGAPGFRASARDARAEQPQWFDTPEQMVAYLRGAAGSDAPPAVPAPPSDPRRPR